MAPPTKRRKTEAQVEEITFDDTARHEYLTGFHKRKVQRTKQAQEAAERRAREEKIAERKKIREERKADLERHVREVNALLHPATDKDEDDDNDGRNEEGGGSQTGPDGEWQGIEDTEPPPVDHEAEYIDEDKYTTVTVETMNVSREALYAASDEDQDEGEGVDDKSILVENGATRSLKPKKATNGQDGSHKSKQKELQYKLNKRKKKSFKYESKEDRKANRMKERIKNRKQANARKAK